MVFEVHRWPASRDRRLGALPQVQDGGVLNGFVDDLIEAELPQTPRAWDKDLSKLAGRWTARSANSPEDVRPRPTIAAVSNLTRLKLVRTSVDEGEGVA